MKNLKAKRKVGQLLVIGFEGKVVPDNLKKLIHDYHIGGIILFSRNIGTQQEVLDLTTNLQRIAKEAGYKYPLLIGVDQENGVVRRLGKGTSTFPGAMALGATNNPENAYVVGKATGRELKALGVNWNMAPVLDVNNNESNPVIGVRSYAESPEKVTEFGRAAMRGMQTEGMITTLKHFPGHGDTNVDSHLDLPVIAHPMNRLEEVELLPFIECIKDGADTVMASHIHFPAIEDREGVPATLSAKVINGLLRERIGFTGVVTTDCMEMKAIAESIGTEKGAVEALKAGIDLVMVSHSYEVQVRVIKEIINSIENGEIDEVRVDQSIQRINQLKDKYLRWEDLSFETKIAVPEIVGSDEYNDLAFRIFLESVTVVKDDGILPLDNERKVLVINPVHNTVYGAEDRSDEKKETLGDALKEYNANVDIIQISNELNETEIESISKKAEVYQTVIIGTLSVRPGSYQIDLVKKLLQKVDTLLVVAIRNPYDLKYFPDVPVYITTYEFTYLALKAAAAGIFGKEKVNGQLPVTLTGFNKNIERGREIHS